jgi:hypothetical protein
MKTLCRLPSLSAWIFLAASCPALADVVTDWNNIAGQIVFAGVPTRSGGSGILDFAVVHAAMHDAIQAFDKRFETYADRVPAASGSPVAAAATAAHDVLAARFPLDAATLQTLLQNYLGGLGLLGDPGRSIGSQAAARILQLRSNDGSFPPVPEIFTGGTDPGEWRPTPPAFAPMAVPWLGAVVPFTVKSTTQLQALEPPPNLKSGRYAREYNEVKALGSLNSTERTPEQTELALFYSPNLILLWERTLGTITSLHMTRIGDSARLFALANMAAADAIIACWADKKYWNFWRPLTAIQEGDRDTNPETVGDPTWVPYLVTPPYPDYTSGANNLTGAMIRILQHFFGDRFTFSVTSTATPRTRTYHRLSEMANDMVNVRIYQGIHFRAADEVARRQGKLAADWAFSHVLRPLNDLRDR